MLSSPSCLCHYHGPGSHDDRGVGVALHQNIGHSFRWCGHESVAYWCTFAGTKTSTTAHRTLTDLEMSSFVPGIKGKTIESSSFRIAWQRLQYRTFWVVAQLKMQAVSAAMTRLHERKLANPNRN